MMKNILEINTEVYNPIDDNLEPVVLIKRSLEKLREQLHPISRAIFDQYLSDSEISDIQIARNLGKDPKTIRKYKENLRKIFLPLK